MHKKILAMVLCLMLVSPYAYARDFAYGDADTIGNAEWVVDAAGDIIPVDDSSRDLGETDSEINAIYLDEIVLGGISYTSLASVTSPMTDASGYTYPTDSGGKTRLYDDAYINLGAGTAIDCYLLLDTDDDDWYVGRDDTDNDFAIGVGSTLGTDERISIVDDATSTQVVIGDGVNAEDKQITIDGNALDYYIGYDDSEDDLVFGVDATVGTKPCMSIQNEATPLLYLHNGLDGFGAVDIDYGSADVTDHTFVSDGGTTIIDGTITLTSGEVLSNATDDTVRVASEDSATVLEVYTPGTSNEDATLLLTADADADAGDRMAISHDGATNSMLFQSDTASADTLATILTLAKTGIVTTTGAINSEVDDASNTSVTDVLNLQHFTSGTAAAGIGTGITFDIENANGTEEEHVSIDAVATTSTNSAEDTDVVISQMSAGTVAESLRLVGEQSATASTILQLTGNTSETNGIVDVMKFVMATGTATNNIGQSISFQPEDATGAEEHATMEVQLTDATRATCDADIFFTQDVAGSLETRVKLDADGSTVSLLGTLPSLLIGDAGEEDTKITFDGAAADFHIGIDDTDDKLKIGIGTALGTTDVISIAGTLDGNIIAIGTDLTSDGTNLYWKGAILND